MVLALMTRRLVTLACVCFSRCRGLGISQTSRRKTFSSSWAEAWKSSAVNELNQNFYEFLYDYKLQQPNML